MIDLLKLDSCISKYKELQRLKDITPQYRGQKFNYLIADVLASHHVDAIPNHRSKGEIDVCFRINDKRFILEAKWEKDPINMDPIAKLGLRLNQRVPSNFGVVLSISGFTQDVLEQMTQAGRPNIFVIGEEVFKALLFGTLDAEVLFDACIDVASFEGKFFITFSDILKYLPRRFRGHLNPSEFPPENEPSILEVVKPFGKIEKYEVLKANLPFGQCGISVCDSIPYVTLNDGIYKLINRDLVKVIDIENPQNRALHIDAPGIVYLVINGCVLAIDKNNTPTIVTRRYPGHVRLFGSGEKINLFSNGYDMQHPSRPARLLLDITGDSFELKSSYPISCGVDACIIDNNRYVVVGSSGVRMYEDGIEKWGTEVLNGAAVEYYNGRILYLENGVCLKSIDLNGNNIQEHVRFSLSGSVGDFAVLDEHEYLFHLCYPSLGETKGCLTHVKMANKAI